MTKRLCLLALVVLSVAPVWTRVTDGPLTNFMNLAGRTDENGYVRISGGAPGSTDGPLTAFANLRARTDENGYLRVSCSTCNSASLTAGGVLFSNGTTATVDATKLFWDNTNKFLGIGTAVPTGPLYLAKTYSTVTSNVRQTVFSDNSVTATGGATTDGYIGLRSELSFGTGGVATKGQGIGLQSIVYADGNGDAASEFASTILAVVSRIGTGRTQTTLPGAYWLEDKNLFGPIGVQPSKLGGTTLVVVNPYNGSPIDVASYGAAIVTGDGIGDGRDATINAATKYAVDDGLFIGGKSTGGGINIGFTNGIRLGGAGSNWSVAASSFGTALNIRDFSTYGIYIHDRTAAQTGPAIYVDTATAGKVGFGIAAPVAFLDISQNTGTPSTLPVPVGFRNGGSDGNTSYTVFQSYGAPNAIFFDRISGTSAANTALLSGEGIGNFAWSGYDGTSNFAVNAQLAGVASENWSSTARGTYITVSTVANTTTTLRERLRIDNQGTLILPTSTQTPAVSNTTANSCGTSAATIAGNNNVGTVTVGATAGTDCTLTFTTTAPVEWICQGNNQTTLGNLVSAVPASTTTARLAGTFVAGDKLNYTCFAR